MRGKIPFDSHIIKFQEASMGLNIVAAVCTVIVIAAGIWAWWLENGPEKKDDKSEKTDHIEDVK